MYYVVSRFLKFITIDFFSNLQVMLRALEERVSSKMTSPLPLFEKKKRLSEPAFNDWFRSILALALVPENKIDELWLWQGIVASQPVGVHVTKFMDYFVNTYFEGNFSISMWNHYKTVGPRTNNNVEGYNSKLEKFVRFFIDENVNSELKYSRSLNPNEARPRRNKLYIIKDEMWHTYKNMLANNEISLSIYTK
jgi:hypothetical protein